MRIRLVGTVGGRIAGAKIPASFNFIPAANAVAASFSCKHKIADSEGNNFKLGNCWEISCLRVSIFHHN